MPDALTAADAKRMRTALESIAGFPKAAEQTNHRGDFLAGLELAASYARVALEDVETIHA